MPENEISLKCIHDLLEMQFEIPDYQRGYRWTEDQVTELLDDIWEFRQKDGKKKEEFYCLQPVVVVPTDDGKYSVVDGQQRLTTILIILEVLKEVRLLLGEDEKYTIAYETRKDSEEFLKSIDLDRRDENIDYFHICQAYETAKHWFETRDKAYKVNFVNTLLASDDVGMNVKVIWYAVNEKHSDPRHIFTRINKGKIPLNNAELIKALFLSQDNFKETGQDAMRLRQLEIASEWDQIEIILRDPNNQFWDFITNGSLKKDNRIEFLFDHIAHNTGSKGHNFTFLEFNRQLQESTRDIESLWKKVKQLFQLFQAWHEDHELYHYIGFLVATGTDLHLLTEAASEMTKTDFQEYLKELICDEIEDDPADLVYAPSKREKDKIRAVLLLFNVLTVLSYNDSSYKFQFGRYKRDAWDIEHIHSVASEMPFDQADRNAWLREVLDYTEHDDFIERIEVYLEKKKEEEREPFEDLFLEIIDHYSEEGDDNDINDISNLALLDASTNRGYGNSVFAIKRERIIEKDRMGWFIPPATKHAFLKYYSNDVDHVKFWGKKDRENYKTALLKMVEPFVQFNIVEA